MPGFLADEGLAELLLNGLQNVLVFDANCIISLFDNAYTVDITVQMSNLNEASFDGYARFNETAFTDRGVIAHVQTSKGDAATFTAGGAISSTTVYGYYVWDLFSGKLLWAENFPIPIVVDTPGQNVVVIPSITFQDKSTV